MNNIEELLKEIKNCTLCADYLPFQPNPVLRVGNQAKLLIIGQAPGRQAHINNLSRSDNSGDNLRKWLNIGKTLFYDVSKVAITSMGFCYPGTYSRGGDKPPRPECARQWHFRLRKLMPNIKLTLLIGSYAQKFYLQDTMRSSLTETVRDWKEYLPDFIPLPHPSWRNNHWIKNNPWFVEQLLPELQSMIKNLIKESS